MAAGVWMAVSPDAEPKQAGALRLQTNHRQLYCQFSNTNQTDKGKRLSETPQLVKDIPMHPACVIGRINALCMAPLSYNIDPRGHKLSAPGY